MADRVRFVSPLERALHLKRLPPLRDVGPRELALLSRYAQEAHYGRGASILEPGDPVNHVTVLVDGALSVSLGEAEPTVHRPPFAVGMLHMVARAPSDVRVVVEEDALVLEVGGEALEDLFEDDTAGLYRQIEQLSRLVLEERKRTIAGTYMVGDEELEPPRELGLIERVLFLRESRLFRKGNMDAVVQLARRLEVARYAAGETLWKVGDPGGFTRVLIQGTVLGTLPDGRTFRAGKGYPLGNIESQCGEPRWYDAVAETDVVSLGTDPDTFHDVLEDHFDMAFDFFSSIARNYLGMIRARRKAGEPVPVSGIYGMVEGSVESKSG